MFKGTTTKNFFTYIFPITVVILATLRLFNLGYSEYIPDEGIIISTLKHYGGFSWEFLLSQRKGPVQFLILLLPYLFTKDVFNEFIFRLPYALVNILSIYVFYLFVKEYSKDKYIALVSTYIFGVNGFMIAFGRVMQYQSLNLLLSSFSLYMFSKKRYVLGSLFFGLSLLSHWDALLILPLISYLILKELSFKSIFNILVTLSIILLPFFIPYTKNYLNNVGNQNYLFSRVSSADLSPSSISNKISDYIFKTELYNPFLFLVPVLLFSILSLFTLVLKGAKKDMVSKDQIAIWIWFLSMFIFFLLFAKKSGTHIYNLYLPLSILSGYGVVSLYRVVSKYLRFVYVLIIIFWFMFLYFQAFVLFVDVKKEYPFEQKNILGLKTKEYTHENLTNNIIGFNHFRNWEEIDNTLKELGATSYYTNEDASISNFYVGVPYSQYGYDFVVGVKRPISFMNDYKMSGIKGKSTVSEIKNLFGETVAKIYILDGKIN